MSYLTCRWMDKQNHSVFTVDLKFIVQNQTSTGYAISQNSCHHLKALVSLFYVCSVFILCDWRWMLFYDLMYVDLSVIGGGWISDFRAVIL